MSEQLQLKSRENLLISIRSLKHSVKRSIYDPFKSYREEIINHYTGEKKTEVDRKFEEYEDVTMQLVNSLADMAEKDSILSEERLILALDKKSDDHKAFVDNALKWFIQNLEPSDILDNLHVFQAAKNIDLKSMVDFTTENRNEKIADLVENRVLSLSQWGQKFRRDEWSNKSVIEAMQSKLIPLANSYAIDVQNELDEQTGGVDVLPADAIIKKYSEQYLDEACEHIMQYISDMMIPDLNSRCEANSGLSSAIAMVPEIANQSLTDNKVVNGIYAALENSDFAELQED